MGHGVPSCQVFDAGTSCSGIEALKARVVLYSFVCHTGLGSGLIEDYAGCKTLCRGLNFTFIDLDVCVCAAQDETGANAAAIKGAGDSKRNIASHRSASARHARTCEQAPGSRLSIHSAYHASVVTSPLP